MFRVGSLEILDANSCTPSGSIFFEAIVMVRSFESKGLGVIVERCSEDVLKFRSSVELSNRLPRVAISAIESALNGCCILQAEGYARRLMFVKPPEFCQAKIAIAYDRRIHYPKRPHHSTARISI